MNTYIIDSKIAARTYALTMAVKLIGNTYREEDCINIAMKFEKYLIGDAKLPEVAEDLNLKVLDMWSRVKESSEKGGSEVTKGFKELIRGYEANS